MANKKNDDMIGLAAAGLIGVLALIFGPNLLKGLGGNNSQQPTSSTESTSSFMSKPKSSGCGCGV